MRSPELPCHASNSQVVERITTERQVRRVSVADGNNCCIGMIALANPARA